MLKQLVLFLSIIQVMHCLSMRSNIWWSRRNENSQHDCDVEFDNENPSLEAKICGYCFAKCQQQFAACLLAQMNEVLDGSLDYCQEKSDKCQKHCFNDKRTSRVAEANWAKVVKVLRQFNSYSPPEEEKKNESNTV